MSTSAPTPFGQSSAVAKSTSKSSSCLTATTKVYGMGASDNAISSSTSSETKNNASEFEAQFWCLVNDYNASLHEIEVNMNAFNEQKAIFHSHDEINQDLTTQENVHSLSMNFGDALEKFTNKSILLLSKHEDLTRQIKESKLLIDSQLSYYMKEGNPSLLQPLDFESERTRQNLLLKLKLTRKGILRLQEVADIAMEFCENSSRKGNYESNSRCSIAAQTKTLFTLLQSDYNRSLELENSFIILSKKMQSVDIHDLLEIDSLQIGGEGSRRRSERNILSSLQLSSPKPLSILVQKHKGPKHQVLSLTDLRQIKLQHVNVARNRFDRRDLSGFSLGRKSIESNRTWRTNNAPEMMETISTLGKSTNSSVFLTHQLDHGMALIRPGWNMNKNQEFKSSMQFELPQNLKILDIKKAEAAALSAFGTTPNKLLNADRTRIKFNMKTTECKALSNEGMLQSLKTPIGPPTSDTKIQINQSSSIFIPTSKSTSNIFEINDLQSKDLKKSIEKNKPVTKKKEDIVELNIFSSNEDMPNTVTTRRDVGAVTERSKVSSYERKGGSVEKDKSTSGLFGNFNSISNALIDTNETNTFTNRNNQTSKTFASQGDINYSSLLTQFYQKFNAAKVNEVGKTLEKYKVGKD